MTKSMTVSLRTSSSSASPGCLLLNLEGTPTIRGTITTYPILLSPLQGPYHQPMSLPCIHTGSPLISLDLCPLPTVPPALNSGLSTMLSLCTKFCIITVSVHFFFFFFKHCSQTRLLSKLDSLHSCLSWMDAQGNFLKSYRGGKDPWLPELRMQAAEKGPDKERRWQVERKRGAREGGGVHVQVSFPDGPCFNRGPRTVSAITKGNGLPDSAPTQTQKEFCL